MKGDAPQRDAPSDAPILVIDIGGTHTKFGYSVGTNPQTYEQRFESDLLRAGDAVAALAGMVHMVIAGSGLRPAVIVATVPGFIDTDFDRVLFAANIPGLNGRYLATELGHLLDVPVLLERDAVLALTGEIMTGVAQGADHVLGLFFGTGIGAAFISGGVPFRGGGWALEIGHMPFRGEGRIFAGMRTDCIEAYCSGRALREVAVRHGVDIAEVFVASRHDDVLAAELALFVRDQSFAVATAVAVCSPRIIVLGGGVLDIEDYPRARLLALIADHAPIAETGRAMDVRWAHHGWASALHGARRVVAEHHSRESRFVSMTPSSDGTGSDVTEGRRRSPRGRRETT